MYARQCTRLRRTKQEKTAKKNWGEPLGGSDFSSMFYRVGEGHLGVRACPSAEVTLVHINGKKQNNEVRCRSDFGD